MRKYPSMSSPLTKLQLLILHKVLLKIWRIVFLFSNIAAVMFSSVEQSNGSGIVTFHLSVHQPFRSSCQ